MAMIRSAFCGIAAGSYGHGEHTTAIEEIVASVRRKAHCRASLPTSACGSGPSSRTAAPSFLARDAGARAAATRGSRASSSSDRQGDNGVAVAIIYWLQQGDGDNGGCQRRPRT